MPITKDLQNKKHYFIFAGKDILVKQGEGKSGREKDSSETPVLPDEKFFHEFISAEKDNLLDAISETQQDYAAAVISGNSNRHASVANGEQDNNFHLRNRREAAEQATVSDGGSISSGLDSSSSFSNNFMFMPLREFCFRNETLAPLARRAKGIAAWHETYRHCPKCGELFCDDKTETALLCPACNFKLYPRIEPCVIVLIHRGDEILLVKNKHSGAKFYSCIAGFIELGETAIDAVRRETKEEVGLELKNIRPLGTQSWPFPDQLMLAYSADYASGELILQEDEIAEARWFKKDALPNKDELPGVGSVAWGMIFAQAQKSINN